MTPAAEKRRHRELYLPETVKQALASARRLRRQLWRLTMNAPAFGPLWKVLGRSHSEVCKMERRLRKKALLLARKDTER